MHWYWDRNEPSTASKNPQMKGYKNKVVLDKRHSNNDLTIQTWRLSTKNGLETENLTMIHSVCFLSCNDCSICYVIKASAKSQMLLVPTSVNNLHLFSLIFNHIPTVDASCAGCQFVFLIEYFVILHRKFQLEIQQ